MEIHYLIKEPNKDNILLLIEKFKPLLNKYARLLNYEDAYQDLVVFFIAMIKEFPSIENEGKIVNYIGKCVRNEYIRLGIKRRRIISLEVELNDNEVGESIDIDVLIDLYNALDRLSERQKFIVIENVVNSKSDCMIGKELGLSRKTVNGDKIKAMYKLKKFLF